MSNPMSRIETGLCSAVGSDSTARTARGTELPAGTPAAPDPATGNLCFCFRLISGDYLLVETLVEDTFVDITFVETALVDTEFVDVASAGGTFVAAPGKGASNRGNSAC